MPLAAHANCLPLSTRASVLALLLAAAMPACAEERSLDQLLELDLAELLNIRVYSASKSELAIARAPGVVRVIDAVEIRRNGYRSLREVLETLPGMQLQRYRTGHSLAWVRGVQSRFNDKLLLLIDGVPQRDSHYGNFDLDHGLPLAHVARIEVINGPGSVLYGSNAFAGVISVTTVDSGAELSLGYGSDDTREAGASWGQGGWFAYADTYASAGFTPQRNAVGGPSLLQAQSDSRYLLLKYRGEHWRAWLSHGSYDYPERYSVAGRFSRWLRSPTYAALEYGRELDRGDLQARAFYLDYDLQRTLTRFTLVDDDVRYNRDSLQELGTALYGLSADWRLVHGHSHWLLGVSHEVDARTAAIERSRNFDADSGEFGPYGAPVDKLVDPHLRRSDSAVYVQYQQPLGQRYELTLGARYDHLSDFDAHFNYRIGLTADWQPYYAKLLFGTAFRTPSHREYLDPESFNPDLQPEHLSTLELQLGRQWSRGDVNLTWFQTRYSDFIKEIEVRISGPGGSLNAEYALNFDRIETSGLELALQARPGARWRLRASASWLLEASEVAGVFDPVLARPETDPGGRSIVALAPRFERFDIEMLARFTLHASVDFQLDEASHIGLQVLHHGRRRIPADYQQAVPDEARSPSNADAFWRVDLSARHRLASAWETDLRIENLFDRRYYSLPFNNPGGYDNQWPGRTLHWRLHYRF